MFGSNGFVCSCLAVLFCLFSTHAQAIEKYTENEFSIPCRAMGTELPIQVLIPDSYKWDDEKYTVLYMVDTRRNAKLMDLADGYSFIHEDILPMLVVRLPEMLLLMPEKETGSGTGWVDSLKEDVFPKIEKRYRVVPFRVLAGDRLRTEIVLQAAYSNPDAFHGLIAERTGMETMDDELIKAIGHRLASIKEQSLMISVPVDRNYRELEMLSAIHRMLVVSPDCKVGLVVHDADIPETKRKAGLFLYKGLKLCYSNWFLNGGAEKNRLSDVEAHYKQLGRANGLEIPIPQGLLDQLGVAWHALGAYSESLEAFRENVELHRHSATAYAALAEAWNANGRGYLTVANYKKALEIAEETSHPLMDLYRKKLEHAHQRLIQNDFSKQNEIKRAGPRKLDI